MGDREKQGWLGDLADSYGAVRLWVIAILGPGLVVSELLQGRLWLGVGLAFICVAVWKQVAKQLGVESPALDRVGDISLAIGGVMLAWHYVRWWLAYLSR